MAVSRAVNGQPGVGKELRKKVLEAIGEYDYVHDYIASGLRTQRSRVVGLVLPDVSCTYFSEMAKVVERGAREEGFSTILAHSEESYEAECTEINLLRGFRVGGMIIAPSGNQQDLDVYRRLKKSGTPFVFVDRMKTNLNCSYVITDECEGALNLGRYLIGKGYRKWGYLKGPDGVSSSQSHEAGLRASLKGPGGKRCSIVGVAAGFMVADGYEGTDKLLEMAKLDVIVAVNDLVAIGALRKLREKGIRVPKDIALAGFSDLDAVDLLDPPLTTVKEPFAEIGKRAIEILIQEMVNPKRPKQKIAIEPELVIRESA